MAGLLHVLFAFSRDQAKKCRFSDRNTDCAQRFAATSKRHESLAYAVARLRSSTVSEPANGGLINAGLFCETRLAHARVE